MIRPILLTASLAALTLLGCAAQSDRPDSADASTQIERLSAEWALVSIRGGPDIRPQLKAAGAHAMPSLTFDAKSGRIAGSAGVNRWSAPLDTEALDQGVFLSGPPISTMMAGPEPAMHVEQMFLGALPEAFTFDTRQTANGLLIIHDESGKELLRFEKTP